MVNNTANAIVYELEDRIAEAVGIPMDNQEHFQVRAVTGDWTSWSWSSCYCAIERQASEHRSGRLC